MDCTFDVESNNLDGFVVGLAAIHFRPASSVFFLGKTSVSCFVVAKLLKILRQEKLA